MSEELLVQHGSPTLAGLKTASLFTCRCSDQGALVERVRAFNRTVRTKGLVLQILRVRQGRALLYLYRPCRLRRDLSGGEASGLLAQCGYRAGTAAGCLRQLRQRLETCEDFPHEIGLFLGYPPEDVRGFLEGRQDCKCVGCWKVYGDAEEAERTFARYRKCTQVYCRQLAQGKSVERLAVAGF